MKRQAIQGLNSIFKDIVKDSLQYSQKKIEFARGQGYHVFNFKLKKCVLCGQGIEEVKRVSKLTPIIFDGAKLEAYPGCRGKKVLEASTP